MIVFCTTCRGRAQHLKETLPRNLQDNRNFEDCKFFVLDYNSEDDLSQYLRHQHAADIDSGRLVTYKYPEAQRFHMAHAKNMAHRLGILEGGDILVNLDADNFTGPGFAEWIAGEMRQADGDVFLWSRMIQHGPDRLPRGISGRIAVTKQQFLLAGGYDEKFSTWSPDDKDFNARLRRLGFDALEIDTQFLNAITHPDQMRFREYKHASTINYDDASILECDTTIANWGNVGCGCVYRNFVNRPIELKPIPTRVFGIGMHKTATTSLHAAFGILGYRSGHWENAHWAKAIWHEIKQDGRSATLERYYAACDLPIPVLFRELDRAYPGSKFILTTRDEGAWLDSVRKHWSHNHNPYRWAWNADPFTNRIHREVYGQRGFDEDVMLTRYRRHNAEVIEYFRDRQQDLLVMNMDHKRGYGWPPLCAFLGEPHPLEPYPRKFVTRDLPEPEYQI